MRISELMTLPKGARRRVGIRFDQQGHAMRAATRIFREAGLDVEVEDRAVWIETPRGMALPIQQILERATGTRGFNDWEGAA